MNIQPTEAHENRSQSFGFPTGFSDAFVRRLSASYPLQMHELAAVSNLVRDVTSIPAHSDILQDGRPARDAVVLLRGLACHYKTMDTARRQMTGFIVPGDFCDFGFLSSSSVRQCVMSLGPAVIGRIDLAQLSALGDKLPNIVVAMMRGASIEQASARELVISLGARDALQRIAHCLCELYARLNVVGVVREDGQFQLATTQAELGEALGLSTVHVNRTVQQLRREKLITMSHGEVQIMDFARLAKVASFDGHYLRS
jgi:CRP-like cAMP-binding protein